jgi:EmrB/QacA subfamily drug resistance transporter
MSDYSTPAGIEPGSYDLCGPASRKFILIAAILASSLGFIDGSMVAIALPAIRDALDGTLAQAQWVSNGYLLPIASIILVGGAIGDRYGLARVFAAGIAMFVLASIACMVATSAGYLIAARVLQGLGAAFMIPGSLALISRAYPKGERGKAIGIWAAASAVTSALGPIVGGVVLTLGEGEAWRMIFAINLPLGALALFLLYRHIENDPGQPERRIDTLGALLAIAAFGLIAMTLTGMEQGHMLGVPVERLAPAAIFTFGLFVMAQFQVKNPMMPMSLFSNPSFSAANMISFLVYFSFSAILFYLPLTLIGGWGQSALATAAAYAPLSVFIALLSGTAGNLADKYGPAYLLIIGSLVLAAGYAILAQVIPTHNFWTRVLPAMFLQGIGMGLIVAPVSTAVMGSVSHVMTGTASGINNALTRIAGLMAVATMGVVVVMTYAASGGPASFGEMLDDQLHRAASDAAFIKVANVSSICCLVSAIIAFIWVPRTKTRQT